MTTGHDIRFPAAELPGDGYEFCKLGTYTAKLVEFDIVKQTALQGGREGSGFLFAVGLWFRQSVKSRCVQ